MWIDADFRTLSDVAKLLYVVLLCDPDRTMVGRLPYAPRRWAAALAKPLIEIETVISELSLRRYVLVDPKTDELLIRTVVKHDPPRGSKLITAMWRAWERIQSEDLRRAVLDEIGAEVWLMDPLSRPAEVDRLLGRAND
jgi:hypothetical protein